MIDLADGLAGVLMIMIMIYLVTGGADFGAGVWELLATGPRKKQQREALARAIAPIWEANHVWLIVVVVVLFVCFPRVHVVIMTSLHLPILLLLLGIVLRGAAFAFRSYAAGSVRTEARWTLVFRMASIAAPLFLGITAGTLASGRLHGAASGPLATADASLWLAPFPLAVGLLVAAACTYLAAVYMTVEVAGDRQLADDFRRRAMLTQVVVGACALLALLAARSGAPRLFDRLVLQWWSIGFQLATAMVALGALHALWRRRYRLARVLSVAQVACIALGWGMAQYPYLVAPDLTISASAAAPQVLRATSWILAIGAVFSVPLMLYLLRVFKSEDRP